MPQRQQCHVPHTKKPQKKKKGEASRGKSLSTTLIKHKKSGREDMNGYIPPEIYSQLQNSI